MLKISVIIPTLNESDNIGNLLYDLSKQLHKPDEIIVVDGKSTDTTKKIIRAFKNVTLLTTEPNPARQRTIGGEKAKNELLIFLDADVRMKKDFLKRVEKSYKKKKFSIACPYYLPHKSNMLIICVYYFFNSMFFLWQKISPSGAGSCIIVTKNVFKKIYGFNSAFRYDDIAFIRKASKISSFCMLPIIVYVSDRRFRNDGVLRTTLKYFLLSFFFMTNQFKSANVIPYRFNHYKRTS